jgi:hypothetical protein
MTDLCLSIKTKVIKLQKLENLEIGDLRGRLAFQLNYDFSYSFVLWIVRFYEMINLV